MKIGYLPSRRVAITGGRYVNYSAGYIMLLRLRTIILLLPRAKRRAISGRTYVTFAITQRWKLLMLGCRISLCLPSPPDGISATLHRFLRF